LLRPLLILAALAQASLAAPSVEQDAFPGLPAVKVQDLHYGDVLFRFYQQDYFESLVRLAAYRDQGRLTAHARDAELLRGGLYLSLGQHREARDIFERLLADPATPADVKSRAWFYLGKLLYASGEYEQSDRALRQSAGNLPEELEAERRLLIAQGLLYRKRYDQAIAELSNWQGPRYWLLYGQFNLGVALVRAGEPARGLALLDGVGSIETKWPELMALRDKANLAIGYARLQAGEPAAARAALERVRLSGPQSSKALLGAGWADAAAQKFEAALLPWQELQGRNLLDAAVQESYLAVPYAYAELGAMAQAVEYYERAIAAYDAERVRIGESIDAIRSGELLASAMKAPGDGREGWFAQMATLPDSPESRYLYHLLAGHEFQEGLKNYRALDAMGRNLSAWSDSLGAFTHMVETRRQAFEQKLPAADARLATVDVATINGRRDELQGEFEAAVSSRDVAALATAKEREQLAMLDEVDAELARPAADASDEMSRASWDGGRWRAAATDQRGDAREKARLARGVLMWKLDAAWKVRSWQARRALRELNASVYDARTRETASGHARVGAPERNAVLGRRVGTLAPRVDVLMLRVENAKGVQAGRLADIAVRELEEQRKRLDEYAIQARYALATIYDRAAAGTGPAKPRGTAP
jgi:tetratricopeptide (TPR) repeat protein